MHSSMKNALLRSLFYLAYTRVAIFANLQNAYSLLCMPMHDKSSDDRLAHIFIEVPVSVVQRYLAMIDEV